MARLLLQPWCLATALLVPLLSLGTPGPLRLDGVAPCWPVLWLLPWALADGRLSGAVAGLGLGLLVDGLHPGPISQMPLLALLGWWWGRIGRLGPPIERSFNLGLLALLGSAVMGVAVMLQWALLALPGRQDPALLAAGLHNLLAQTLLTALLAPILCSLQLLLWRQLLAGSRG